MIKPISISGGNPTNLPPLLFIMFISMIKDFIEDRTRRKSDAKENDAPVDYLHVSEDGGTSFRTITWKEI